MEVLTPYKVRPAPEQMPGAWETGTQSHEGAAGIAAAVNYFAWIGESMASDYLSRYAAFSGRRQAVHAAMDCLFDYEAGIASQLIEGLTALDGVRVLGITDPEAMSRRVPTVSFTVDGVDPAHIARSMADRNIFIWNGHNYALEAAELLGILDKGSAVRVGPVHYNTKQEIDEFLEVLARILA
jgi:selenocysteine lyase/cysteine desulfurase